MRSVMQNPLPNCDVTCVSFVITAGVEIAIVFREGGGGDGDAYITRSFRSVSTVR